MDKMDSLLTEYQAGNLIIIFMLFIFTIWNVFNLGRK